MTLHRRLYSHPQLESMWGQVVKVKSETGQAVKASLIKTSPGAQWVTLMLNSQDQGWIFSVIKGSSTKIWWVKILTLVAGVSTNNYVVSPSCRWKRVSELAVLLNFDLKIIFSFTLCVGGNIHVHHPAPTLGVEHSCNVTYLKKLCMFICRTKHYLGMCA